MLHHLVDVAKSEHCVSHLLEGVLDEQPLQMRLYHDELLYPQEKWCYEYS